MTRWLLIVLVILASIPTRAQLSYAMTATTGTYAYNSGTQLLGSSVDENISASTSIGFTFKFGCANYTTFQASSNGVLYLGTSIASAPFDNVPNLSGNTDRPIIAPLWDDLETSSTGKVNYKLTGTSPNRVLTVEWLNMLWDYFASGKVISFQAKLYETSGQIDFIYKVENIANLYSPYAASGLAGATTGDFYSLSDFGTNPTASKTTETDNISSAPATNQIYRWTPNSCSGTPAGISASASPVSLCAAGTATLSLSGTSGCGLTYQWQSASAGSGPWTNITGATSSTQTVSVPAAGSYYQCVVTCSGLSGTSSTVHVTVGTPSNNDCSGATALTIGNCVAGDVNCASQSQIGCVGTADDDVWYSFTATGTAHDISLSASSSFDPVVELFLGSCGSLTSIWCDDVDYTTGGSMQCRATTGLTVGNTYYLRVYDYYSGTPATTGFTVCVSAGPSASCGLNYTLSSITNSQDAGVNTTITLSDDHLSNAIALPFGFCFDGYLYSEIYVCSNASLVFDAVDPCSPNVDQSRIPASSGAPTGYSISGPVPTTTDYVPQNAILAPWHDIDPGNGGTITYATLGTSPNRRFVVSFNAVKQFELSSPCQNTSYDYTGQIKLYETTNNIEIHIQQMNSCASWNNGQAILGLHNGTGTMALVPAGYNANASSPYNVYSITNAAWRFTNNCTSCNIVLPVDMVEFTATTLDDENNEITWRTANERSVKWFYLERSVDGVNFTEIARVAPLSPLGASYEHKDKLPDARSTYYYRVATENMDGSIEYSGLRVVERNSNLVAAIRDVYPNPFVDDLNFDVESAGDVDVTIEVYGMFGRVVYRQQCKLADGVNTVHIDDFDKQKGLYLVRLIDQEGKELLVKKMIRQ